MKDSTGEKSISAPGPLTSAWVKAREAALNFLVNMRGGEVLNPAPTRGTSKGNHLAAGEVMAEIKVAAHAFKELAIDAEGYRVDYEVLRESEAYKKYQEECAPGLREIDLNVLGTDDHAKAFWINLYNTLVIDGVISYQINETVAEGWIGLMRFFRRTAYNVGGLRVSLDDIEHGVLRANRGHPYLPGPQFSAHDRRMRCVMPNFDPRVHFAINCASQSCPPIKVYSGEKLDAQLDLATRNFLDHEVSLEGDKLVVSSIFKWYLRDFGGRKGLVSFLQNYLPEDERRERLRSEGEEVKLGYLPYDWSLNV